MLAGKKRNQDFLRGLNNKENDTKSVLHGHGECELRTRRRMSAKSPWEGS